MRGGKRQGAGRKHRLTPAEREEVAREYHRRMQIYAAAQAHVRDPNIIKRRDIYKQMREVAGTHIAMPGDENLLLDPEEDVIWAHKHKQMWPKIERLKAEFDSISNKSAAVTPKRAKGAGDSLLQDIAVDWKISKRMVKSCINDFPKKYFDFCT